MSGSCAVMEKAQGVRGQQIWVLPLTCCVTLSKLLSLSGPLFPLYQLGRKTADVHPPPPKKKPLWNCCPYYSHLMDEETEEQ